MTRIKFNRVRTRGVSHPHMAWCIGDVALSKCEAVILWAVMCRRLVTMTEMIEGIYQNPDDEPTYPADAVRSLVFNLNEKLTGTGWLVRGSSGRGLCHPGYALESVAEISKKKMAA